MSKPKGFEKPIGVKDYMPDVVDRLRTIEHNVLECMRRWGYRQVITPTLEYYDTVGIATTTSDRKLFKLLDRNGTTVVLRSELTAPIARVAASLLKKQPQPLRLSYHANVFRSPEEEAGRDAEFFQTGVEFIGDGSADADGEVIALAVASLKAAGVEDFQIAFGHVGYLHGLFQEALPGRIEEQQALKDCLLNRDFVGYRNLLHKFTDLPQIQLGLEAALRLRGGHEVCEQATALTDDPAAIKAIHQLGEIWRVLEDYGVCDHVMIDLTMIGDFSYYTGMTFEGYAAEMGFPVCSGGRYDNLLDQFGHAAPATGFALKTNRILEHLGGGRLSPEQVTKIVYIAGQRKTALAAAKNLRHQGGRRVETIYVTPHEAQQAVWRSNQEEHVEWMEFLEG